MGTKAKWGPKSFLTSPHKIIPFNDFSTSVTLKSDSENDTSGTEPTNTRGRELQPLSCSTTYHAAAGNDPWAEFHSWASLVGEKYPLFVGGRRLGPAERFILKGVDVTGMTQAEDGTVISLTLGLSFTEESEGKSSKLVKASGGTSASGISSANRAGATYEQLVAEKNAAKNATASTADKTERKRGAANRWSQTAMEM
jgi:hypothetical protein